MVRVWLMHPSDFSTSASSLAHLLVVVLGVVASVVDMLVPWLGLQFAAAPEKLLEIAPLVLGGGAVCGVDAAVAVSDKGVEVVYGAAAAVAISADGAKGDAGKEAGSEGGDRHA
jgi:hypothetical protein